MKASAHSILSATTAVGLTAFAIVSAFTANGSASVTAAGLGLFATYGIVEMMILSYGPRRWVRPPARVRVVALPSAAPARTVMATFPTASSRRCAA